MTTHQDIRNDLDDVAEPILEYLTLQDRLRLTLECIAAGEHENVDKLKETVEWKTYRQPLMEYEDWIKEALYVGLFACYRLEVGVWRFQTERLRGLYYDQLRRQFDTDAEGWEFVPEATEDNEWGELPARKAAADFYAKYLAWERFAERAANVDIQTFLSLSAPQETVDMIETHVELATGRYMEQMADSSEVDISGDEDIEDSGWAANMTVSAGGEEHPPEEAADIMVERILAAWTSDEPQTG